MSTHRSCCFVRAVLRSTIFAIILAIVAVKLVTARQHAVGVSAYYTMDSKRGNRAQSDAVYFAMFRNTLKINVHTIFFYDTHENYLKLSAIRNESYPTTWVQRNLSEFTTYQRLPDLSAMWMEKIEMVHHASKIVDAEWYAWIDAGIVPYRNMPTPTVPWPEKNLTAKYPHNKFIYHNFQGRHAVSGTAYLVPSGIVEVFRHLFFSALEMCLMVHPTFEDAKAHYHDDQDILKVVVTSHPHLCYNDPIQGLNWGALVTENYVTPHRLEAGGCMVWDGKSLNWCP